MKKTIPSVEEIARQINAELWSRYDSEPQATRDDEAVRVSLEKAERIRRIYTEQLGV